MKAVILAAGDGGRLAPFTHGTPKPLLRVSGRPLLQYTLEALAGAGVGDVVVVVGYRAEQLEQGARSIPSEVSFAFVPNPAFTGGASLSLRAAREACGDDPFLLLMADHMLSREIVAALVGAWKPGGPSLIATDASAWPAAYLREATRVRFQDASPAVAAIGKGLEPFDALDTGAFLLGPAVWRALDAVPEDCELSVVFTELARREGLHGVDVSGATWYDVDTAADLDAANELVASGGAR